MKVATVSLLNSEKKEQIRIKICDDFISRFKGLMFISEISNDEGILLVQESESKINSAIHMFFMNFDIAVFWMDKNFNIVDKIIAKKWKLIYAPSQPAKYILETHPDNIKKFQIGETLKISNYL